MPSEARTVYTPQRVRWPHALCQRLTIHTRVSGTRLYSRPLTPRRHPQEISGKQQAWGGGNSPGLGLQRAQQRWGPRRTHSPTAPLCKVLSTSGSSRGGFSSLWCKAPPNIRSATFRLAPHTLAPTVGSLVVDGFGQLWVNVDALSTLGVCPDAQESGTWDAFPLCDGCIRSEPMVSRGHLHSIYTHRSPER